MARRTRSAPWSRLFAAGLKAVTSHSSRTLAQASARAVSKAVQAGVDALKPPPGPGGWIGGVALGAAGARRYRLYLPPGVKLGEHLPLMVMLHGCGQDAKSFAISTRMNRLAARQRFAVLYPEQDRLANAQGCWNWFDSRSGRTQGEAALILKAIDQVCLLYPVDRTRVAMAGLSAGASMAAVLATKHPDRFKAVVMHSGIPPGSAHSTLSAIGAMRGRRTALPPLAPALAKAASWPPLMVIHGGADLVVSARNGLAAAQLWADAAGASAGQPRSVQRGKRHAATVTDFRRSRSLVATLVEVGQLGHAWSGGAARQPFSDAQGPDASRMAWAFVLKQLQA
jgi:poly(hydroxyalkanoate) depolymerase family esterase